MKKEYFSEYEPRFFNPTNDVAFKKIFGDHDTLTKSFLNATLRLTGEQTIQKVEFLPTERLPLTSESKKSILDVLCTDQNGAQYIIEVQIYTQRIQYYFAHAYVGQLEKSETYLKLKPVTLLSILNHSIFPPQVKYLSFHENIETETHHSYLNEMSDAFIELPKFSKKMEELQTVEDYWIFTMKQGHLLREAPRGAPKEVRQAFEILERHTWTRSERFAYEEAKIAIMDDLNAVEGAKNEGIKEGIKEGIAQTEKRIAITMIKNGASLEQIARDTGLSRAEVEKLSSGLREGIE